MQLLSLNGMSILIIILKFVVLLALFLVFLMLLVWLGKRLVMVGLFRVVLDLVGDKKEVIFVKRKHISRRKSHKRFARTATAVRKKNLRVHPMRGGFRI